MFSLNEPELISCKQMAAKQGHHGAELGGLWWSAPLGRYIRHLNECLLFYNTMMIFRTILVWLQVFKVLTGSGSGIGAFWRFLSAILDLRANAGDCGSSHVKLFRCTPRLQKRVKVSGSLTNEDRGLLGWDANGSLHHALAHRLGVEH